MTSSLPRGLVFLLPLLAAFLVRAQDRTGAEHVSQSDDELVKLVTKLGGKMARDDRLDGRTIVELDFSGTEVIDDDLRLLSHLAELRTLNLHRTAVSDDGLKHLTTLSRLKTLTLGDTKITNRGLRALNGLDQLEAIGLHGTLIDDEGMSYLKTFPRLKSLFLSKTAVTNEAMKTVKGMEHLELLWLAQSRITDAGLAEIKALPRLQVLSLESTSITDDGLWQLAGLRQLHYLNVRGTNVTKPGLSRLTAENKIEHVLHNHPWKVPGVTIAVGDPVPELSAIDLNGLSWKVAELHRLAGSSNRLPIVMTFWCSFCPSCRQIEHDLDALAKRYVGRAVVVAVDASAGESSEVCRKVASEKGLSLPILLDPSGRTADVFGTETTTTTVVIDANGVLRYCGQFAHDSERYAEAALDAILDGKAVASPTTSHRGCPIVRK